MEAARRERSDLKLRVPTQTYLENPEVLAVHFSSWIYSAVHLLTSSPKTQLLPQIADRIGVSIEKVREVLKFSSEHHFVSHENER